MNAEQLAGWLAARLPKIPRLNLTPAQTRVTHVMNWGGFVNHSFLIEDGSARYHLKLTDDLDSVRLRRWREVSAILKQRYRAPEVIDWVELPEVGLCGLLQQHLDGHTPNFRNDPFLVQQLIELVDCLHKDVDLRAHLNASGSSKTYLDHFVETYIERFNADMNIVTEAQLPFVSPALAKWMRDETDRLHAMADSRREFHIRAIEPVHSDLNENNVLVTADGWFVLDWDDLALGDPAIDFAVLVWPIVFSGGDRTLVSLPDLDDGLWKRTELCLRAQFLDEVIDPLADYAAAGAVPSRQAEVERIKRKQHEEALERYKEVVGDKEDGPLPPRSH